MVNAIAGLDPSRARRRIFVEAVEQKKFTYSYAYAAFTRGCGEKVGWSRVSGENGRLSSLGIVSIVQHKQAGSWFQVGRFEGLARVVCVAYCGARSSTAVDRGFCGRTRSNTIENFDRGVQFVHEFQRGKI